jgi:hypothetical protein
MVSLDDFPPSLDSVSVTEPTEFNHYPSTSLSLGGVRILFNRMRPDEVSSFLELTAAEVRKASGELLDRSHHHTCADGEWCERCELEDRIHEHETEVSA